MRGIQGRAEDRAKAFGAKACRAKDCMQDTFARATHSAGRPSAARDDRVYCIQGKRIAGRVQKTGQGMMGMGIMQYEHSSGAGQGQNAGHEKGKGPK